SNLSHGTVAGVSGVTAGTLVISDTGAVTQTAAITATNLALLGAGGSYTLNNAGNQIGVLAANTGSVSLTDASNLSIGTVAGVSGVTAGTLVISDTGAVTQTAAITATNLALLGAGGSYTLTNAGNQIGPLAANTGSISLIDASNLSIGTVAGVSGVTAGTLVIPDAGAVTQTAAITASNLALLGA